MHPVAAPLDYSVLRVKSTMPSRVCGIGSLAVGVLGTAIAFYLAYTLNSVPPGSSIRPMDLALFILLTAAGTLLLGLVLGIACITKSSRRGSLVVLGLLGIVVSCLGPWYASKAEVDHIVAKNHLVMED